jgi:ADP-ribosylglycohydrolase
MFFPSDYVEKVYAGVLGKIIGVYLGRPFEGWTYEKIMQELGEIRYYVHDKRGVPLVVTDDDISGTFTFLRALPDQANSLDLTPEQIGHTWLNYLIENRTVLWWGGLGNSTEHTAYLRLKNGIKAPLSGSIAENGKVVAEQIGAQIFIDGWAMVSPGDPEQAADLARRAASVSHDGEAIYAAQVLAAMEAQAFIEPDIHRLVDIGVSLIPKDSTIYHLIADLQEWHSEIKDWREARKKLVEFYGYDKYGGNCHVVPNHGLIVLGLLYGEDDFQKSLMITNTSGWDTDCNSGNLGCLMGIKNGLAGLDAGPDWRGPVKDMLYLPTADGGRCITDAASEAYQIVNIARSFTQLPPLMPKDGARYHFELPGSVQGFQVEATPDGASRLQLNNLTGQSILGERCLGISYEGLKPGWYGEVSVPTFVSPEAMNMPGYSLYASPTIYPGQTLHVDLIADRHNQRRVFCQIFLAYYGEDDQIFISYGPQEWLSPGMVWRSGWRLEMPEGAPIARIGLRLQSEEPSKGVIYLDRVSWEGEAEVTWTAPSWSGSAWRKAWVNGVDHFLSWDEPFRLIQDSGTGLLIQGAREWQDYNITADITPHMVEAAGIAARVQGMRRYYALLLDRKSLVRLVKVRNRVVDLAQKVFNWQFGDTHLLSMSVQDRRIKCWVDSQLVFDLVDNDQPLANGAVALVVTDGRTATRRVKVGPA